MRFAIRSRPNPALRLVAAVIFAARRNTAKADIGAGMELDVITAVVLGGTSIFGGRGNVVGTVLGVLLIHETKQFVSWRWNNDVLNPAFRALLASDFEVIKLGVRPPAAPTRLRIVGL